jgi:hypothetical protein
VESKNTLSFISPNSILYMAEYGSAATARHLTVQCDGGAASARQLIVQHDDSAATGMQLTVQHDGSS